ncbi:MAG: 50S ribosomal protein L35 [candidate division WOR-3 bacterium]
MPKIKTKKAAAKRFSLTGTGKVKRGRAKTSHLKFSKNQKTKRRLRRSTTLKPQDAKGVKRALGKG